MPDERDDTEKAREHMGVKPAQGATVEDATGSDAVVAKPTGTITESGLVTPGENPDQFDATAED